MDFIEAFGGLLIGSFAVIIFFVVMPGIVALVAGVLLGITAAIPIVPLGALNYLVHKDSKAENFDDAHTEKILDVRNRQPLDQPLLTSLWQP